MKDGGGLLMINIVKGTINLDGLIERYDVATG